MKRKMVTGILLAAMAVTIAGCGGQNHAAQNGTEMSGKDTQAQDIPVDNSEDAAGVVAVAGPIAAAADENGNFVVNGSFEELDFTGWTVTNVDNVTEELDIYTRDTDCYDGVQSLHFYSGSHNVNFVAEQTLTGLEAGTYKLSGFVQGDTAGDADSDIHFYAVIDGETYTAPAELKGYVNWQESVLEHLEVANGEITIGISGTNAAGGWGTIDAISLVKE